MPNFGDVSSLVFVPNNNFSATAAPTSSDDAGDGWSVGSLWYDTDHDHVYTCIDATVGAAVWQQIDGTGAGGSYTASNIGTGIPVLDGTVVSDFQFRGVAANSSKVSVSHDDPNNNVAIDIVPSNISHNDLSGISGGGSGDIWHLTQAQLNLLIATQTANRVFASPNGSSGAPSYRQLYDGDIASAAAIAASKIGISTGNINGFFSGITAGGDVQAFLEAIDDYALRKPSGVGVVRYNGSGNPAMSIASINSLSSARDNVFYANTLSGNNTWDIQSIPSGYERIELHLYVRASATATLHEVFVNFNNDGTDTNYFNEVSYAGVQASVNVSGGIHYAKPIIAWTPAASSPASSYATIKLTIFNYDQTSGYKNFIAESFVYYDSGYALVVKVGGMWLNTAAINRISIVPKTGAPPVASTFVANSRASLHLINAGSTFVSSIS